MSCGGHDGDPNLICKSFNTTAAFALLGLAPFTFAHAAQTSLDLDSTVVTATRVDTPTPALAATTVIDREEIERSQATSLPDVLRRVPGLSLANNGGPGKTTNLFLRGTNSDHMIVLIDGVKVGAVSNGAAAYQDFPVELIERIEVVRGPRSSLYGSEAIGGVIQIFTRKGEGQGVRPFFSAGYGTHDTLSGSAGITGGDGKGWYSLGINSEDTDGIDATNHNSFSNDPDADGYRNLAGSLNVGYRFDNGLELAGNLLRAKTHNEYDGGDDAYMDGEQHVVGGSARYAPLNNWMVTLQAGRSQDKSDSYSDGSFSSRFDSRRDQFSWQNDIELAERHTLTLGYDYLQDELSSDSNYQMNSRHNNGGFAQYLGGAGRFDWQLNARRDVNETFGGHNTGAVALGYALIESLRGYVSYGTAFKAPTFTQLYYPGFFGMYEGNPDLEPEESKNLEVGLEGQPGWGSWSVNLFRNEIDNLIAATGPNNGYINVDEALIHGAEFNVASDWQGWFWSANATLLEAENRSDGANNGRSLPRRPQQLFNLEMDRAFDRFSVGATLHAEGARYNDAANQTELGGFATLDLRAEYRIDQEWRLQTRVANLLDANYQTIDGYNQPGQAVYFTVRYQAL